MRIFLKRKRNDLLISEVVGEIKKLLNPNCHMGHTEPKELVNKVKNVIKVLPCEIAVLRQEFFYYTVSCIFVYNSYPSVLDIYPYLDKHIGVGIIARVFGDSSAQFWWKYFLKFDMSIYATDLFPVHVYIDSHSYDVGIFNIGIEKGDYRKKNYSDMRLLIYDKIKKEWILETGKQKKEVV